MRISVPLERQSGETRVALVPESVKKLAGMGVEIAVERSAGDKAGFRDGDYTAAGAQIGDRASLLQGADVLTCVNRPEADDYGRLKPNTVIIGFLKPLDDPGGLEPIVRKQLSAFAVELVPRITRAQSMDALSSMATIAGYKAVILAAETLPRMFPMLMTAAGTISPARVFVLGVGVAGLQAIATARRLGAVVEAYDVRAAVKDEVKSLGATFVELPLEAQQGQGGYAAQQSEEFLRRQRELIGDHVAASDVVITTAAVPGRKAPILVTKDMVARMRPGSVIVDLAADTGGNVELTKPGEAVVTSGVTIDGPRNLASTMPVHASQLFSRNVR